MILNYSSDQTDVFKFGRYLLTIDRRFDQDYTSFSTIPNIRKITYHHGCVRDDAKTAIGRDGPQSTVRPRTVVQTKKMWSPVVFTHSDQNEKGEKNVGV